MSTLVRWTIVAVANCSSWGCWSGRAVTIITKGTTWALSGPGRSSRGPEALWRASTPRGRAESPSLLDALLPIVVLIALLALTIVLFGVSATDGPLQVALLLSAAFASWSPSRTATRSPPLPRRPWVA